MSLSERWITQVAARRRTKAALLWGIVLTLMLYVVPFGEWLGYPLILLSTLVHELGHGIAAVLVGGRFERFAVFPDASGIAYTTEIPAGWPRAVVAAGGLVGPSVTAGLAFLCARSAAWSRALLVAFAALLVVVLVLLVRNPFGIGFAGLLITGLGWFGLRARPSTAQIATVFVAIQLALSVFSRGGYLFAETAHTGVGTAPSDVAAMAQALGGPYWVWGLVCGACSVLALVVGIRAFGRGAWARPRTRGPVLRRD